MKRMLFTIITVLSFLISGCVSVESQQGYSAFADYAGVRVANDEFLSVFRYVYEIGMYVPGGEDLVFWAVDGLLFDLVFFELYDDPFFSCGKFYIIPGTVVLSIPILTRGEAVLIRNHAPLSNLAISFLDTDGQRRYIGVCQNFAPQAPLSFGFIEFKLMPGLDAENPFELYAVFEGYVGIRLLNNKELLGGFEYIHEVHHTDIDGFWDDLVIWAIDNPLMSFEFLELDFGFHDDFYFIPGEVLFSLDPLPPEQAFVIRSHSWSGHWGTRAISFLDTEGQRRYLMIQKDFAVGAGVPWWFNEFGIEGAGPPFGPPPWD